MTATSVNDSLRRRLSGEGYRYSYISNQTQLTYKRIIEIFERDSEMTCEELFLICAAFRIDPLSLAGSPK